MPAKVSWGGFLERMTFKVGLEMWIQHARKKVTKRVSLGISMQQLLLQLRNYHTPYYRDRKWRPEVSQQLCLNNKKLRNTCLHLVVLQNGQNMPLQSSSFLYALTVLLFFLLLTHSLTATILSTEVLWKSPFRENQLPYTIYVFTIRVLPWSVASSPGTSSPATLSNARCLFFSHNLDHREKLGGWGEERGARLLGPHCYSSSLISTVE